MLETISLLGGIVGAIIIVRRFGLWSLPAFVVLLFLAGFQLRIILLELSDQRTVFGLVPVDSSSFQSAAGFGLIAFVFMVIGICVAGWRSKRAVELIEPRTRAYVGPWVLLTAVGVTVTQVVLMSIPYGGVAEAIAALSTRTLATDTNGFAANLTFASGPLFLLAIMAFVRSGRVFGAAFSSILMVVAMAWCSLVNGRAIIIVGIWALVYVWFRSTGRKPRTGAVIGLALAVPVVTIVGLAWRTTAQSGRPFAEVLSTVWSSGLTSVSDALPLFDHLQVGVRFASTVPNGSAGPFIANAFTVLVPRSVWADKPEYLPQLLGQTVGRSTLSGLPAGLLGEGYIVAGWFGAALFALLFGLAIGLLHRMISNTAVAGPVLAWLSFTVFALALSGLRTGAQGALMSLQIALLFLPVVAVAAILIRGPSKVSGAPATASSLSSRAAIRQT